MCHGVYHSFRKQARTAGNQAKEKRDLLQFQLETFLPGSFEGLVPSFHGYFKGCGRFRERDSLVAVGPQGGSLTVLLTTGSGHALCFLVLQGLDSLTTYSSHLGWSWSSSMKSIENPHAPLSCSAWHVVTGQQKWLSGTVKTGTSYEQSQEHVVSKDSIYFISRELLSDII